MTVRKLITTLIIPIALITLWSCSDSDSGNDPVPVVLENGEAYFPLHEGDTWYYTDDDQNQIIRIVSGDTTINSLPCKKILHVTGVDTVTEEAWSADSLAFYIHLLDEVLWFDPPLDIPFTLTQDAPYAYNSQVYNGIDNVGVAIGTLTFLGYVTKTVGAGTFTDAIKIYYDEDAPYSEFYAPNVGLLDNEDIILDSAVINGISYPQ